MQQKYYLPINDTSLAHYIRKATILPSRFYNNRPNDIQDFFSDYIFLSNKPYVNKTNCSLELALNDTEISQLVNINNDIILLKKPLPISRIKKIYFSNTHQKKITIDNINRGTGFINTNIATVIEISSGTRIEIEIPKLPDHRYDEKLEASIKKNDRMLGGLAFVRFNINNTYANNYFSIAAFFNDSIRKEYENGSGIKTIKAYDGAFDFNGKWEELEIIYRSIEEKDVINFADKDNISLEKDIGDNFKLDKIKHDSQTYKLSILHTYGTCNQQRKSIDDLIEAFKSDKIKEKSQDGISLIVGINNGYSAFYNKYNDKIVKFKMDSMLDYYTVESVFQYAINGNKSSNFNYLDKIIDEKQEIMSFQHATYRVFDETIITDKKSNTAELIEHVEKGILGRVFFQPVIDFITKIFKKKDELNILHEEKCNEINQQQEEISNLNSTVKELTSNKYKLQTKLDEECFKVEKLNQDFNNEKNKLNILHEEKCNEINQQQEEISNLNSTVKDLTSNKQKLQTKLDEERFKVEKLNQDFNNEKNKLNILHEEKCNEINQQQEEISNLNSTVKELTSNKYKLQTKLDEECFKVEKLNQDFNNEKNKLNILHEEKSNEINQQQEEISNLNSTFNKLTSNKKQPIDSTIESNSPINKKYNQKDLGCKKKNELFEIAKQMNRNVRIKDTKKNIINKILEHQEPLLPNM